MDSLVIPAKNVNKGEEEQDRDKGTKNQTSDSGCEDTNIEKPVNGTTTLTDIEINEKTEDTDDIVILRRDPTGKRNLINKTAYVRLHRAVSPEKNRIYVGSLKERYENKIENDKCNSPTDFGIPRYNHISPRLPVPKPRSKVKSLIVPSTKKSDQDKLRFSLQIHKESNHNDENCNEIFTQSSSSSGEFVTIVVRSDSEESVDKLEKELNLFTMDTKPKDKKRSNSFRKIFSGRIFGKDKKKKNEEELPKMTYRENISNSVNMQKESNSFSRHAAYRHTTGSLGSIPRGTKTARHSEQLMNNPYKIKELEDRYARMHVHEFNHIKQNFENQRPKPPPVDYVPMDKSTINTPGPTTYTKYIDTSSSTSTAELEENSPYQNNSQINNSRRRDSRGPLIVAYRDKSRDRSRERSRERNTPPRAQDIRQDVKLVNPKALIPINSERALPIPYQNRQVSSLEKPKVNSKSGNINAKRNENTQPYFEETYGTVFDSIDKQHTSKMEKNGSENNISDTKIPKSPTKLKLPPNREIVPLSPRLKSPIPHDNISTDKMIATELLKPRSPSPSKKNTISRVQTSSHQRLEVGIDYPDNISNEQYERHIVTTKPPISRIPPQRNTDSWSPSRQRVSQHSPAFDKISSQTSLTFENQEDKNIRHRLSQASPVGHPEKAVSNLLIHNNPNTRTPTPSSIAQHRSMSPITVTPVDMRPPSVSSLSPQKEDMRRSVEAFYWREIKKLKEQENMDLYYYQMNMMPSNYHEEPISTRRSRSLSPSSHRNSRRSLSLPRDPKPRFQDNQDNYGRIETHSIPEGRAVINQDNVFYQANNYQQNFRRNVPERKTVDNMQMVNGNYNSNSLYRPIFKRGSLTTPVKEIEDSQNKKVSFSNNNSSGQNMQAFTKNGLKYNIPQNRMYNENEVFYQQNNPRVFVDSGELYGYTNRPLNSTTYPKQQQVIIAPNHPNFHYRSQMTQEPTYRIRQNLDMGIRPQDALYGQPRAPIRHPFALTRHGSMQLPERPQVFRKMSYDNQVEQPRPPNLQGHVIPRREIIVQDEIFGQFGGYIQSEDPYGYSRRQAESLYGYSQHPKHISVNNRVCDMYGQIHDSNTGLAKNSGVLLGQIRNSPQVTRHLSHENFQRNTRLTSSANDMYGRYPRNTLSRQNNRIYQQQLYPDTEIIIPNRPLPPVPKETRDENGFKNEESNVSSVLKKDKSNIKIKKRFFFGKKYKPYSMMETEETKHLTTPNLQRLVLLEQLHHIRFQTSHSSCATETTETKHMSTSALQRLVLLEQLRQIRAAVTKDSYAKEYEETKKFKTSDLERIALLEQLHLIKLQR